MENEKVLDTELKDSIDKSFEGLETKIDEKLKGMEDTISKILVTPSQKEEDKLQKGGFDDIGDFAKNIMSRNVTEKMKNWMNVASKTLNEGTDSEGGFLVPPEFSSSLWMRSTEQSNFYDKAFKIPTSSNEYHMPALVDESHASNLYGGVNTYYKKEEAQYTESHPKFREIEWRLNKLTGMAYVSDELLEDSNQNQSAMISQLFTNAMAWRMDKDMLVGTGVGQPLGIFNSPAKIAVAVETGQDTSQPFKYENAIKMLARLYGNRGEWIANKTMLPYLATMTLEGGTASTPLWIPGNDASKAPHGTLLGRNINYSEHCESANTTGDIYLVDWSQYGVAHKTGGGMDTATSMHLKFDYDQVAFKIRFRWDGQPMWNKAFTPANGDTLAPIITLATRS